MNKKYKEYKVNSKIKTSRNYDEYDEIFLDEVDATVMDEILRGQQMGLFTLTKEEINELNSYKNDEEIKYFWDEKGLKYGFNPKTVTQLGLYLGESRFTAKLRDTKEES